MIGQGGRPTWESVWCLLLSSLQTNGSLKLHTHRAITDVCPSLVPIPSSPLPPPKHVRFWWDLACHQKLQG
ncbi:MAG: hypothetical protein J3Q66DRAFT_355429 [Benniella sp.]|nr:MAG: hypothetical protein J3Q66DRAFT_355429 [Benniella sp.]